MSERKRGGLNYTARAFPGARNPDGPAPDLSEKLAKLGLLEGAEPIEVRTNNIPADISAQSRPISKKRTELDYTPRAFPGARDPDGLAPGIEDRLIKSGWAQPAETRETQPVARPDARPAPPPPRREQPAAPPAPNPSPPIRARAPEQTSSREPASAQLQPRSERTAPPASSPTAQRSPLAAKSQPVYFETSASEPTSDERAGFVLSPASNAPHWPKVPPEPAPRPTPAVAEPSLDASRLPRVPPEAVPRPAPVVAESRDHEPHPSIPKAAAKATPRPASRAGRGPVRVRQLADKEERTRLSLRLAGAIDAKLDDLAHLRGLDRNTAVSVAIAQDWVACFGLQARQA